MDNYVKILVPQERLDEIRKNSMKVRRIRKSCIHCVGRTVSDKEHDKFWEGVGICELNDHPCERELGNPCDMYEEEVSNV